MAPMTADQNSVEAMILQISSRTSCSNLPGREESPREVQEQSFELKLY